MSEILQRSEIPLDTGIAQLVDRFFQV